MAKGKNSAPGLLTTATADILYRAMTDLRSSKAAVARATGIPRTTVGPMIDGTSVMDVEQLDLVCQALGLQVEDVMEEAAERSEGRLLTSPVQRIVRKKGSDLAHA